MGRIVEGVWDCKYCDTTRIRGSITKCPHCGKTRDGYTKFYIADPKNYVLEEEAQKINKNPDWQCAYCGSLNHEGTNKCYQCGASRDGTELNYFEAVKKYQNEDIKREHYFNDDIDNADEIEESVEVEQEKQEASVQEVSRYYDEKSDIKEHKINTFFSALKNHIKPILICFCILAIIATVVYLCVPKTVDITVNGVEWSRSIKIEEYKTVLEDDWSIPTGGRLQYTQQEIYTYQKVLDHYETKTRTYTERVLDHYEERVVGHRDLGNGHFEEITSSSPVYRTETKTETYKDPVYISVPVYKTKYYYEIERWVYKTTVNTNGFDKEPIWGEYDYDVYEREGGRSEEYTIQGITKKGKTKEYELPYEEWNTVNIGDNISLKSNSFGNANIIEK